MRVALSRGAASRDVYPDFFLDDQTGLLFRHVVGGEGSVDKYRVCVPTSARAEVLKEMHDAPSSGHFGKDRTYIRAAQDFTWRNLRSDVEAYVATCAKCQRHKAYTASARGIPTPLEAPDGRWQAVALDQSINLLLFLQKQNLATAIYLFGLGTLLTGLGLKHMRICSHHGLVGALVTSLFLGGPWLSTTSPTCLPLSVFTITSDQHRCRIPPLL